MTFFDTEAGYRFTSYTMPRLVDELERLNNKKIIQKCDNIPKESLELTIRTRLSEGYRYVDAVDLGDRYLLITEKEEE